MNREVELKLELAPDAADAFGRLTFLPAKSAATSMQAMYFDTPDRDLAARGSSLRIRQSHGRRVQTVKGAGSGAAGLFARAEWEMPVDDDVPVLDARTPIAAMLGDAVHAIEPVFHIDLERRTWTIADGTAEIELVLDRGQVIAGNRLAPVCEVELELKSGAPEALFRLARRVDAEMAVRPGIISKAERGYMLRDAVATSAKAEAVRLDPAMTVGDGFTRIAGNCLRHYRLNEMLLLDHYDARALHQARVAVRRLRSALWLFKPLLDPTEAARFLSELKWLADVLGEARNLDVLAGVGELRERLEPVQAQAHARVGQWIESARVRALLIDLAEWLALGAVRQEVSVPMADFATQRLQRLRKRMVRRGRHLAKLRDEERHEIRKDAKKLRYASEFFADLFDGKKRRRQQARFIAALEQVQDGLGLLNDLVARPAVLAEHGLEGDAPVRPKQKRRLMGKAAGAYDAWVETPRFW